MKFFLRSRMWSEVNKCILSCDQYSFFIRTNRWNDLEPDKLTAAALATSLLARSRFSWYCWRSSGWYAFGMYSFHAFLCVWLEVSLGDPPVALVTVSFSRFGKYRSGNVPSYVILYFARAVTWKASGEHVQPKTLRKTCDSNAIPQFLKTK